MGFSTPSEVTDGRIEAYVIAKDGSEANRLKPAEICKKNSTDVYCDLII